MSASWFFYVYEGNGEPGRPGLWGQRVAAGTCPTRADAEREGARYLAQYQQDGPAHLVIRKAPTPRAPKPERKQK